MLLVDLYRPIKSTYFFFVTTHNSLEYFPFTSVPLIAYNTLMCVLRMGIIWILLFIINDFRFAWQNHIWMLGVWTLNKQLCTFHHYHPHQPLPSESSPLWTILLFTFLLLHFPFVVKHSLPPFGLGERNECVNVRECVKELQTYRTINNVQMFYFPSRLRFN